MATNWATNLMHLMVLWRNGSFVSSRSLSCSYFALVQGSASAEEVVIAEEPGKKKKKKKRSAEDAALDTTGAAPMEIGTPPFLMTN